MRMARAASARALGRSSSSVWRVRNPIELKTFEGAESPLGFWTPDIGSGRV
jgi:hypothetical protein